MKKITQSLLQRLNEIPNTDASECFIEFLNDLMNCSITSGHQRLAEEVEMKAQALGMQENQLVGAALRHIENNRALIDKLRPSSARSVQSISGCYPFRR